eukprot:UN12475
MGTVFKEPLQVDPISTGGFSSRKENPIQKYQQDAVAQYLKTKGERPGNLQTSNRCVPDISVIDEQFYIVP